MASHLFDKAALVERRAVAPTPPAILLHHPILFVATVWVVFYVAIALMA
ncbi:hypothetical protein [Methylocella sp.]|jgi:hypothetical protein